MHFVVVRTRNAWTADTVCPNMSSNLVILTYMGRTQTSAVITNFHYDSNIVLTFSRTSRSTTIDFLWCVMSYLVSTSLFRRRLLCHRLTKSRPRLKYEHEFFSLKLVLNVAIIVTSHIQGCVYVNLAKQFSHLHLQDQTQHARS